MNVKAALERMSAAGIRLELSEGKLTVEASSPLTEEQRVFIRAHRGELVEYLGSMPSRAELYRRWFRDLEGERRALITLSDEQVQQAITAGLITAEDAEGAVMVAYCNSNACCVMAIPESRYDGIGILELINAATDSRTH